MSVFARASVASHVRCILDIKEFLYTLGAELLQIVGCISVFRMLSPEQAVAQMGAQIGAQIGAHIGAKSNTKTHFLKRLFKVYCVVVLVPFC